MFNPDLGHLLLLRLERHQVNRKGASQFIKHHSVKKKKPKTSSIAPKHLLSRNSFNNFPAINKFHSSSQGRGLSLV